MTDGERAFEISLFSPDRYAQVIVCVHQLIEQRSWLEQRSVEHKTKQSRTKAGSTVSAMVAASVLVRVFVMLSTEHPQYTQLMCKKKKKMITILGKGRKSRGKKTRLKDDGTSTGKGRCCERSCKSRLPPFPLRKRGQGVVVAASI
jgi:hypothetical protein